MKNEPREILDSAGSEDSPSRMIPVVALVVELVFALLLAYGIMYPSQNYPLLYRVTGGSVLIFLIGIIWAHRTGHSILRLANATTIFFLVFCIAATMQASHLYAYQVRFYELCHYAIVAALVYLIARGERKSACGILLIILYFSPVYDMMFWSERHTARYLLAVVTAMSLLCEGGERQLSLPRPVLWSLLAFLLWGVVATMVAPYPWDSWEGVLLWSNAAFVFFVIAEYVDEERELKLMVGLMLIVAAVTCVEGLGQWIRVWVYTGEEALVYRLTAFLLHPISFGKYLAMMGLVGLFAIPWVWRSTTARVVGAAFLVLSAVCIVLTLSRHSYIGVTCGAIVLLYLGVRRRRRMARGVGGRWTVVTVVVVSLVLISFAGVFIVAPTLRSQLFSARRTIPYRVQSWKVAASAIRERPVMGAGWAVRNNHYGNARFYDPTPEEHRAMLTSSFVLGHANNTWLEIANSAGVPAAVLFTVFLVLFGIFVRSRGLVRGSPIGIGVAAGLIAILSMSFMGYPFYQHGTLLSFFVLMGILVASSGRAFRHRPNRIESSMSAAVFALVALMATVMVAFHGGSRLLAERISRDAASFEQRKSYDKAIERLQLAGRIDLGNIDYLTREAHNWYRKCEHEKAREIYQKALAVRVDDPFSLENLGWASLEIGETEEAVRAFRKAVRLDPSGAVGGDHYAALATALTLSGDRDGAIENLKTAFIFNEKLLTALDTNGARRLGIGRECALTRDYSPLRSILSSTLDQICEELPAQVSDTSVAFWGYVNRVMQALTLLERYDKAHEVLDVLEGFTEDRWAIDGSRAGIYLKQNQLDDVKVLLEKMEDHVGLAKLFARMGNLEEAESEIDKIPGTVSSLDIELIGVCISVGEFAFAKTICRQELARNPRSIEALRQLARVYEAQGDDDGAVVAYRKAVQLAYGSGWIHAELARLLYRQDKKDAARRELRISHRVMPNNINVLLRTGWILDEEKKPEEALEMFLKAQRKHPDSQWAAAVLGDAYKRRGDYEQALKWCRYALRLKPDDLNANISLAQVYEASGKMEEAIAQFERAVELQPYSSWAHKALGWAYEKAGMKQRALEEYRAAVKYDPTAKDALEALHRLRVEQR